MIHGLAVTPFDVASILIVLAATLGYINHRLLKLPESVGLTVMGAAASLVVVGLDVALPASGVSAEIVRFCRRCSMRIFAGW